MRDDEINILNCKVKLKVKVKLSRCRRGQAQSFPGS